jgi:phosphoglycolate phosphatase-like HAD superfamily hydrolase
LTGYDTIPAKPVLWLFDFDNTLAALEPEVDWTASRRELEGYLRNEGISDAIFAEFPKGNLVLYEALRSRLRDGTYAPPRSISSDQLLQGASRIVESFELRGVPQAAPLPGATELLRALANGNTSIIVVTSNSSRTVGRWFKLNHMNGLVHAVVGRDSMLALKPAPDSIQHALALCSTSPDNAVFVGDSEADLNAARRAHVGFYGVAAGEEARRKLIAAGARKVFAFPAALAAYLSVPRPRTDD